MNGSRYLEKITRLAGRLRPRFEKGELRGFNNADSDALEKVSRENLNRTPKAWDRACRRVSDRLPHNRLADAVIRGLHLEDDRNAGQVVALSPSTARLRLPGDTPLFGHALSAACWDVLRIARSGGWYPVTVGEEPTDAELRGRRPKTERARASAYWSLLGLA